MSADPVPVVSPPEIPAAQTRVCANCGAPLGGEFCAACGQRHEPHVHTLGHFATEAFESVTHADSRLWRTLGYLLVKPGHLSREFFSGRRARYLPPFRLYLVISLLFFVFAGMSGMKIETDGKASNDTVEGLNSAADSLEKQFPNTPGIAETAAELRQEAARKQAELDGTAPAPKPEARDEDSDNVRVGFCEGVAKPAPGAGWAAESLFNYCQKVSHMSGKALIESVVHNIPRAMFVFLPLLAAFMKVLYWRPRRYYVEHLLFLVHNHAFVFLAMMLMVLMTRIPVIGSQLGLLEAAVSFYVVWYIFRAMRVYYGQSRWMTFGKYVVIGFAYFMTSAVVLAGTVIFSTLML
jgi:uncharacterized protein DUF3667